ncbi:hypothetical protein PR003_g35138 [Phytophthora rubi]|uniref:Secreted protein n=1 Tax=Phytophthora rubi TaxID=129364 RepID=A0A6A4AKB1_9STRA|nr:hypothetical protein PR003_g35138 [Phytophthora rubi]
MRWHRSPWRQLQSPYSIPLLLGFACCSPLSVAASHSHSHLQPPVLVATRRQLRRCHPVHIPQSPSAQSPEADCPGSGTTSERCCGPLASFRHPGALRANYRIRHPPQSWPGRPTGGPAW